MPELPACNSSFLPRFSARAAFLLPREKVKIENEDLVQLFTSSVVISSRLNLNFFEDFRLEIKKLEGFFFFFLLVSFYIDIYPS